MKSVLPTDCGNAPRVTIVGEFVTHWARGDTEAMTAWLADDVEWTVAGRGTADSERVIERVCPDGAVRVLEVTSIITHGRHASCDGFVDTDAGRMHFSHVFRFGGASKSARIREARTYLVGLT